MRKIGKWIVGVFVLVLAIAVGGLIMAHRGVVKETSVLPSTSLIETSGGEGDLPWRLTWINSASQEMPRSAVLDEGQDPSPSAGYVMSHPSFVLEWPDGKILLVDAGMTREDAASFGRPLEWVSGAKPMQVLGSVSEQIGDVRSKVKGAIFTHLHTDHVSGIRELCNGRAEPIAIPMTEAQAERPNYTTRPGLAMIHDAPCLKEVRLQNGPIYQVPGFPGVMVLAAGGHTPGSQIVIARVGSGAAPVTWVFTGDIVNNIDGINHNIPKPYLYSLLVVPEARGRLNELRMYLRGLRDNGRFNLLVAHDQLQIEASGVKQFGQSASQTSDTAS